MKLIIDIPDEDYDVILENANYYIEKHWGLPTVWSAIRNGTPYEERPQGEWLPFKYNFDLPEPNEYGSYVQILKDKKETHWEEYWGPEFVCSKCHAKNHKANYCPNCGARMRGKK